MRTHTEWWSNHRIKEELFNGGDVDVFKVNEITINGKEIVK